MQTAPILYPLPLMWEGISDATINCGLLLLSYYKYCIIYKFLKYYLQTWADAFKGQPELKEVEKQYQDLKKKGIEFPMADLDKMAPIHTPARVCDSFLLLTFLAKVLFFFMKLFCFSHWSFI